MTINLKILLGFIIISWLLHSCTVEENNKKSPAEELKEKLRKIKGKGILFGHQDDLAYGIGWKYKEGESDVKRVTGDYPAIFGWDIGGIELGWKKNLDSVPFDKMRSYIIKAHEMGGINTISWHTFMASDSSNSWTRDSTIVKRIIPGGDLHTTFNLHLDAVADFMTDLKDKEDNLVPIIFRPWHEMIGSWFWWGQKQCSIEEYKTLYRYTVDYLTRIKGLNNLLFAFSPDQNFESKELYLERYPGDDVVDILGFDDYGDLKPKRDFNKAIDRLNIVIDIAKEKKKLAAFTETGLENVTDSLWYTNKLAKVIDFQKIAKELSYVMLWRSDEDVHFYFSYPGHPSEQDARKFCEKDNIWLLGDLNGFEKKNH